MPKGEQRSNREVRKPKKAKAAAPSAPVLGSQVRSADSGNKSATPKK